MASTRKLTVPQILRLDVALKALDGTSVDGKFSVYSFEDDADIKWQIAKNQDVVERERRAIEKVVNQKVLELSPVKRDISLEDEPARASFRIWSEAFDEKEIEVSGLLELSRRKLQNGGKNAIPPTVLRGLMPILGE